MIHVAAKQNELQCNVEGTYLCVVLWRNGRPQARCIALLYLDVDTKVDIHRIAGTGVAENSWQFFSNPHDEHTIDPCASQHQTL